MRLLRKMAWPISLVYGGVVYVRNLLYDANIFSSKSYDIPTICVGNLSVGGTGKTPMIEFLISKLGGEYKLAVLSRGYKRKSKGYQFAGKDANVELLGDEPFQIHQKFPKAFVAVDADRQHGIEELVRTVEPDLILLDDAFQHRKVKPSFSILLTTYANPFDNDWYLPTGDLRDSKQAAQRADCIIVTKCPSDVSSGEMEVFAQGLRRSQNQIVLFSRLIYDEVLYGYRSNLSLQDLENKPFTLVTGIANPEPLVSFLNGLNVEFEHLTFPDHHSFTASEIAQIKKRPNVITTEKDFTRLGDTLENIHYIRIAHEFLENGEELLLTAIEDRLKPYC